jgi:hypothetical protein
MVEEGDVVKFSDQFVKCASVVGFDKIDPQLKDHLYANLKINFVGLFGWDTNGNEYAIDFKNIETGEIASIFLKEDGTLALPNDSKDFRLLWHVKVFTSIKDDKMTDDDRCKNCKTLGQLKNMCCVCPKCGNIIWGI